MNWQKLWTAMGGRKFVGFALASVFLACGLISDVVWLSAFGLYVGSNVAQKVLLAKGDTPYVERDW
jgi:hypothetical protein